MHSWTDHQWHKFLPHCNKNCKIGSKVTKWKTCLLEHGYEGWPSFKISIQFSQSVISICVLLHIEPPFCMCTHTCFLFLITNKSTHSSATTVQLLSLRLSQYILLKFYHRTYIKIKTLQFTNLLKKTDCEWFESHTKMLDLNMYTASTATCTIQTGNITSLI